MGSERSLDPRQILYGQAPPARQMYFKPPGDYTTAELLPENAEEMSLLLKALAVLADHGEPRAGQIERQLCKALWIDDLGRAADHKAIAKTYKMVLMKDPDAHDLQLEAWQWGVCLRALDHCMDNDLEQLAGQEQEDEARLWADASALHERISRAICLENGAGPLQEYINCCVCCRRIHYLESEAVASGTYCRGCAPVS